MLKCHWISKNILNDDDIYQMVDSFHKVRPRLGAFDTETDGLHLTLSTPFLYQFGFVDELNKVGYTFTVDIERNRALAMKTINTWHNICRTLTIYVGHNIKYDIHMMANIGIQLTHNNISDTMFYIRYAHDALTVENGGPPLKLKDYTARYIDPKAKYHEQKIKQAQSQKAKEYNSYLAKRLKAIGIKLKEVQEFLKDCVHDVEDLPKHIYEVYCEWLANDIPLSLRNKIHGLVEADDIGYNTLDRAMVTEYAHMDIVLTLEALMLTEPTVIARGQQKAIEIENSVIYPFWEMERTGFKIDVPYLRTAKKNLKLFIIRIRQEMFRLLGTTFRISQSVFIRDTFNKRFNMSIASTGAEELGLLHSQLIRDKADKDAIRFIELLKLARTLEKWLSTYVNRFLKELEKTDILYTQINIVGAVSGRVSSDFQQFPKGAIKDFEGNEIFNPRRMVIVEDQNKDFIVYLDYSQIELRFQAMYTILCGDPDLNLCRAYMPYKCVNKKEIPFDYNNIKHIKNYDKCKWFLEEEPNKEWKPTDVHGATTKIAFDIDEEHPDWDMLRYKGKTTNFAKNYGATIIRIKAMFPDMSDEQCKKIDEAYYLAFPGVKTYHQYCYDRADNFSFTTNMFGVRYYGVSGHKLMNMLIQGSSAFYLKIKIAEIYKYMKANNLQSKMMMQIHDELQFKQSRFDSLQHILNIKRIMEDWNDALVPVVADLEIAKSRWNEKKKATTKSDILKCLK